MNRKEFVEQYRAIVNRALHCATKARKESILGLTTEIDKEKADQRHIFDYGLRFVTDATDPYYIDKILSNLVEQEKDEQMRTLKKMQKEAVLLIQQGMNAEMVHTVLNSLTDIPLDQDKILTRANMTAKSKLSPTAEEKIVVKSDCNFFHFVL
jgi:flagellar motor component MotA